MGPQSAHALVMYMLAESRRRNEDMAFMLYAGESLRLAPQNMYIGERFSNIIRPPAEIDVESTIDSVVSKAAKGA